MDWGRIGADIASGGLYEGYRYLQGQAGKGYDTAAQGAQQAAGGYQDLANTQWGQAMQGLNQGQHAYDPSNLEWEKLYGRGPQAGATGDALTQYGRYLGNGPSDASTAYGNSQMALANQNAGADFYGQHGGALGNYSASEQAYNQNRNAYSQPGRTEGLFYTPTNNMGDFAAGLAGQQGTGDTTRGAAEIGGYYRNANDVAQYAGTQMGQLQGPGTYEQFVTSDINGTNPQMQRETDQGLARINQEMARRGAFHSGAADTSIGNFLGQEAASDYQNRANRAQSAQQMQLGRIGAGQSLSQASAQNKLAQGQALQGLAGQTDAEKMGRLAQQLQAQQGASQEGLSNTQQQLGYATAADQERLARLAGGMGAAGQSDQNQLARLGMGFQMGNTTDQTALARQMGLYGMAQGADQGNLARYGMLGNLSGQMDANQLAQMNAMMGSRFGLDAGASGNIGNFYGLGMGAYGQDMGNSYNALANMFGLQGQGQNAQAALPWQLASLGTQAYGASRGGRG